MFDRVEVDSDVDLPGFEGDPADPDWQTKSLGHPGLRLFRLTDEGRLARTHHESEEIPDDEIDEDRIGHRRRVVDEWDETIEDFEGRFTFYTLRDGEWVEFLATFEDGEMVSIESVDRHDDRAIELNTT